MVLLEPQATEEGGLPYTAIEQDFPILDVWLILERNPLITAVLNQWVNSYKRLIPGFEAQRAHAGYGTRWGVSRPRFCLRAFDGVPAPQPALGRRGYEAIGELPGEVHGHLVGNRCQVEQWR